MSDPSFQTWICPTCHDDHWWPEGPYCNVIAKQNADLAEIIEALLDTFAIYGMDWHPNTLQQAVMDRVALLVKKHRPDEGAFTARIGWAEERRNAIEGKA